MEKHDYDYTRDDSPEKVMKSKSQWAKELDEHVFHITREAGTERAFTGRFHDHKVPGIYTCSNCGHPLFSSRTKFDSGTGWPSYWSPISNVSIDTRDDWKLFVKRTEVICQRCGAHLGHVFDDGPQPTGLRYCINSAALSFQAK